MKKNISIALLLGIFNINALASSFDLSIGVGSESETSDKLLNIGYSGYFIDETFRFGAGINGSFSDKDNPFMDGLFYLGVKHKKINVEAIAGGTLSSYGNKDLVGFTVGGKIGYQFYDNHKIELVYLSSTLEDSASVEYDRKRTNINYVYTFMTK